MKKAQARIAIVLIFTGIIPLLIYGSFTYLVIQTVGNPQKNLNSVLATGLIMISFLVTTLAYVLSKRFLPKQEEPKAEKEPNTDEILDLIEQHINAESGEEELLLSKKATEIVNQHRHLLKDKKVELFFHHEPAYEVKLPWPQVAFVIGVLVRNSMNHTHSGAITVITTDAMIQVNDTGAAQGLAYEVAVVDKHVFGEKALPLDLSLVIAFCQRYDWKLTLLNEPGNKTCAAITFDDIEPPPRPLHLR